MIFIIKKNCINEKNLPTNQLKVDLLFWLLKQKQKTH